MFERQFVRSWNLLTRSFGFGRPIYHFPVKTNFMGLSEAKATQINAFYMRYLPTSGVQLDVDVLNNRRHQIIGVALPAVIAVAAFIQFAYYNISTPPKVSMQTPAPGWEVPA